ncbi:HAMP domain-containing protein [bacterium 1XD8-76]|nr:HAMP domain-containing protein [bacterium 1XD8-76]
MKIRDRMILVVLTVVVASGILITGIWYHTSSKMTDQYLTDISESTMRDAYNAFDYMLTDTSYMLTMLSLNEKNIINPVRKLKGLGRRPDGQWNLEYLENKRTIYDYIAGMNGHKYYIVGITIVVDEDCIFDTFHLAQNQRELYEEICKLDQETLKTKMVMMDPIHAEASKSTISSDYVVPAVRGILDKDRNVIGYAVLYFDYGVIEQIFAANLPEGSHFQVVNRNQSIIFSNCGEELIDVEKPERGFIYNKFEAADIGWTFTMALPTDFYLGSLRRTTFMTGILMVIIILASVIAIAFLISRITSEITNLRDSMHLVSSGNLDVVYEVRGKDEIAQMGETFNHMVSRIDTLVKRIAEEEKEKRLVEISFLEAQINPHFVSNVLNNVTWMAKIQHADNIVPLVQSLNSMLQNVMHQEEDMILLKNELSYVQNYLRIVEYSGKFDCEVQEDIAEDTENLLVLRFILQPILENAINHGLAGSLSRQERILIRSYIEDEKLILTIEDNGSGMTEEQIKRIMREKTERQKHFNGIGIPNVMERIRLFFGEKYGLRYESEVGEYTRAIFTLPVIKGEGE